jgi:DNA invertase Pin-like site-specific DNA recombinase
MRAYFSNAGLFWSHTKKTPKKSIRKMAQEINQVTKISISHMTVRRILNNNIIKAYSPLKKPLLSKKYSYKEREM